MRGVCGVVVEGMRLRQRTTEDGRCSGILEVAGNRLQQLLG